MKYKINVLRPHKYLKYSHFELNNRFSSRKAALAWVGEFVGKSIAGSERWVLKGGIDGPFAVEIISEKETWHVAFSIAKGECEYEMTEEDEIIMEEWIESGPKAVEHIFKKREELQKKKKTKIIS